jgi:hypothetical protein
MYHVRPPKSQKLFVAIEEQGLEAERTSETANRMIDSILSPAVIFALQIGSRSRNS